MVPQHWSLHGGVWIRDDGERIVPLSNRAGWQIEGITSQAFHASALSAIKHLDAIAPYSKPHT